MNRFPYPLIVVASRVSVIAASSVCLQFAIHSVQIFSDVSSFSFLIFSSAITPSCKTRETKTVKVREILTKFVQGL